MMREDGAAPGGRGPRAWDVLEGVLVILLGYDCFLYYNLVGHIASLRGRDFGPSMLTVSDALVPYMPFWVLFYQIAYFIPALVLVLLLSKLLDDLAELRRIMAAFLVLLCVHFALYLLVPTSAHAVRLPVSQLGTGWLGAMVRYQYQLATPWNAWPSLHVSACWLFFRTLWRYRHPVRTPYLVWFLGMLVGTAAIKIHYVLDGATGMALGEAAWRFVYQPMSRAGVRLDGSVGRGVRIGLLAIALAGLASGIPLLMAVSGFEGPLYRFVPAPAPPGR